MSTMFTLSGAISWVVKQAQLNANAVSLWEGWQMIAQAITKWQIEARGPGHPCTHLPAFPCHSVFAMRMGLYWKQGPRVHWWACMEEPRHTHQTSHHDWGSDNTTWLGSQPEAVRPKSCTDPITFTFMRLQIWEWQRFSVSFLIGVIKVQ